MDYANKSPTFIFEPYELRSMAIDTLCQLQSPLYPLLHPKRFSGTQPCEVEVNIHSGPVPKIEVVLDTPRNQSAQAQACMESSLRRITGSDVFAGPEILGRSRNKPTRLKYTAPLETFQESLRTSPLPAMRTAYDKALHHAQTLKTARELAGHTSGSVTQHLAALYLSANPHYKTTDIPTSWLGRIAMVPNASSTATQLLQDEKILAEKLSSTIQSFGFPSVKWQGEGGSSLTLQAKHAKSKKEYWILVTPLKEDRIPIPLFLPWIARKVIRSGNETLLVRVMPAAHQPVSEESIHKMEQLCKDSGLTPAITFRGSEINEKNIGSITFPTSSGAKTLPVMLDWGMCKRPSAAETRNLVKKCKTLPQLEPYYDLEAYITKERKEFERLNAQQKPTL